jgi:coenzyme F420-reducing hydrogenase delta subunit
MKDVGAHVIQSVPVEYSPRFGQHIADCLHTPFELLLFATDPQFIQRAVAAGVDGIIVDCEYIGKESRQAGADTEINQHTFADLQRVRACTSARVLCRINRYGAVTAGEVEQAIAAGTDEILLPMVQTPAEVEVVLDQVRGRCGVGILVETVPALAVVEELGALPLSRVYLGLNDLGIARKTPNIFTAVADGTLEYVRQYFRMPFGFGGVTLPERGYPIPCHLLMGELARLNCSFTFLRRSFWADTHGRNLMVEVPRIREALDVAAHRSMALVVRDRVALHEAIAGWNPMPASRCQELSADIPTRS